MDDYEPSIHEHETKKDAMDDWNDNKIYRDGQKCVAKVLVMERAP